MGKYKAIQVLAALAAAFALLFSAGCKSDLEKACANVEELAEKAGEKMADVGEDCVKELEKERKKGRCENFDEVIECVIDATDYKSVKKECWKKVCKRKKD